MASALRTGVIGCGGLGPSEAKISHEMDGIELVGVVDVNIESAQAVADELGVKAFSHHGDLIDEGLDAILVVTPTWTHREICVDAANAGIAVFCEKPMALQLDDCDAMIAAADSNGVPLMLGFVMRYWPLYVEVHKRLQNGDIGDLKLAWSTRLSGRPPVGVGEWRLDRKLVGGTWSSSVHELDLLLWMGGPVASVHGNATFGTFANTDLEDTFISTLNYENGAIGSLHSSQIYPAGASNFGLAGTKGAISHQQARRPAPGYPRRQPRADRGRVPQRGHAQPTGRVLRLRPLRRGHPCPTATTAAAPWKSAWQRSCPPSKAGTSFCRSSAGTTQDWQIAKH